MKVSCKPRKWQDKNGQDRYTTEVVVDGFSGVMQMLDSRTGGDTSFNQDNAYNQSSNKQNNQSAPQNPQQSAPAAQPFEEDFDDDIPF